MARDDVPNLLCLYCRCLEMSFAVMCFNVFHTCNKSVIAPAPRLCYEDCHLFDKVHCKYEVEMARKHSSAFELLPDCTQLPKKNKLCKPMNGFVFGKFVAFPSSLSEIINIHTSYSLNFTTFLFMCTNTAC